MTIKLSGAKIFQPRKKFYNTDPGSGKRDVILPFKMDPPSQVMSPPETEFSRGSPSSPDDPAGLPLRLLTGMMPLSMVMRGRPEDEKEGRFWCC